jgi:large subunit ribosomal protein L17
MRHRKAGRKLGMDSSARDAMFRNMVTSLMLHGQIKTTEARAKELRRFAERVITLGKNARAEDANRLHAVRRARLWVNNDEAMDKVFGEYADRFANRPGGYTRVIKAGRRPGDNAPMAIISLVEGLEPVRLVPDSEEAAEPVEAKEGSEE